ncbi:MerR family transcriptional regulator [Pseudolysinimonas sp.]|jgi:DNA-binding transcriptional MerR regulator|uniref:MerR family transcriptional regulator n=1 Tax=Pseudolysinimonas sp. TaxID=2680009 RepID=UPI0037850988
MRISELARLSDSTPATIKFYVREGLLAPGERLGANQSAYDDTHLARVRLIRALVEVGGLSIAGTRAVLAALDDDGLALGYVLEAASQALPVSVPPSPTGETAGRQRIDDLVADRGWHVGPGNAGRVVAARVLDDYRALGRDDLTATLEVYADAAELVAVADLGAVAAATSRAAMTETVVVGTVLGDVLFAGLRRMAHEEAAMRRFPVPGSTPAPPAAPDTDPTEEPSS